MPKPRSVTIHDVAAEAGVSKSLVSRVITGNGAVSPRAKERVQDAIRTLEYRSNVAAQSLASGKSRTIGVLLRRSTSQFYAQLMFELQRAVAPDAYRLIAVTGNLDNASEQQSLSTLLELRVDGLVIGSGHMPTSVIAPIAAIVPTVVIGRAAPNTLADVVRVDSKAQAELAVQHAQRHGHTHVGALAVDSLSGEHRTRDLIAAANAARLRVSSVAAGFDYPEALRACRQLLSQADRPSLVLPFTFEGGLAALAAATECGLNVPHDVSVLAFDHHSLGYPVAGDLTCLSHPTRHYADAAWRLLKARLDGSQTGPQTELIGSEFHPGATLATLTGS